MVFIPTDRQLLLKPDQIVPKNDVTVVRHT